MGPRLCEIKREAREAEETQVRRQGDGFSENGLRIQKALPKRRSHRERGTSLRPFAAFLLLRQRDIRPPASYSENVHHIP